MYVATENNSLYAIDAAAGDILLYRNLSPPGETAVPSRGANAMIPTCFTGNVVGINSTPVIGPANELAPSGAMYVITYSYGGSQRLHYYIHELDLRTLNDVIPPVLVQASRTAFGSNGITATFTFNAADQQQSAALVLANGNVYAGFSSFCDFPIGFVGGGTTTRGSRGWLIGWNAESLAPLLNVAADADDLELTNLDPTALFPLASIWMSNAGPAADDKGVYFATGNSASTYDFSAFPNIPGSIQESFVGVSFDLTTIQGIFTPSNQPALDQGDIDFGAGGVMLLPRSTLAVAAGKYDWDGTNGGMYVLDRTAINPFVNPSGNQPVVSMGNPMGPCFCGPSYFQDASGAGHIVSSGGATTTQQSNQMYGANLIVWEVPPPNNGGNPLAPETMNYLTPPSDTNTIYTDFATGFFTSISSTNINTNTIIWAVLQVYRHERQANKAAPTECIKDQFDIYYTCKEVWLYAFDATQVNKKKPLPQIFSAQAGIWDPQTGGKANLVVRRNHRIPYWDDACDNARCARGSISR